MRKQVMKISIIVFCVLLFAALCVITFVDFDALKPEYRTVQYSATTGGYIRGKSDQTIEKGKDAEEVTAVPNPGYVFLRWSDTNSLDPNRKDTNITENLKSQAKFAKISDTKFKVLLVFATEVDATFADVNGNDIVADYKMTDFDVGVCKKIRSLFEMYLNEIFDGRVTFEVDEYFTRNVMREENFVYSIEEMYDGYKEVSTRLYAEDIPEISNMLANYDSYITTYPLTCDINTLVGGKRDHYKSDSLNYQYLFFGGSSLPDSDKQNFFENYSHFKWGDILDDYLRSFIGTVAQGFDLAWEAPYHYVYMSYYKDENHKLNIGRELNNGFAAVKDYLLGQADYNGKKVGIPFEAWTGDICTVSCVSNDESMGKTWFISSDQQYRIDRQTINVVKGGSTPIIVAIPENGYRFVGWSDGFDGPIRQGHFIESDVQLTAYFEPDDE